MFKKKRMFIGLAALLFAAIATTGCDKQTFRAETYRSGQTIASITIVARDRLVEILPADDNAVTVDYYVSEKEYYDISVTDGQMRMELLYDKSWTDYVGTSGNKSDRVIRLRVPSGLQTLSVQTTNRDVTVGAIDTTDLTVSTNKGDVVLADVSSVSLTLSAKDGDIRGTLPGTYDTYRMQIAIKKGESNLTNKDGGSKNLTITVNNGNVALQLATA